MINLTRCKFSDSKHRFPVMDRLTVEIADRHALQYWTDADIPSSALDPLLDLNSPSLLQFSKTRTYCRPFSPRLCFAVIDCRLTTEYAAAALVSENDAGVGKKISGGHL